MKTKNLIRLPLVAGFAALLCAVASGSQVPVDLRSAGNFAILSKSGITNVPASAIVGNIGTSPITGAAITGFSGHLGNYKIQFTVDGKAHEAGGGAVVVATGGVPVETNDQFTGELVESSNERFRTSSA